MKQMIYGITYIINRQIFKKHTPLVAGLTVTNKCNLRCRHCRVTYREAEDLSLEEAITILDSFYKEGGRAVYLQGGEPFIWHDRQYRNEVRNRQSRFKADYLLGINIVKICWKKRKSSIFWSWAIGLLYFSACRLFGRRTWK